MVRFELLLPLYYYESFKCEDLSFKGEELGMGYTSFADLEVGQRFTLLPVKIYDALGACRDSTPRPHQRILCFPEGGSIPWLTKA
jgi:hypothetical protein